MAKKVSENRNSVLFSDTNDFFGGCLEGRKYAATGKKLVHVPLYSEKNQGEFSCTFGVCPAKERRKNKTSAKSPEIDIKFPSCVKDCRCRQQWGSYICSRLHVERNNQTRDEQT